MIADLVVTVALHYVDRGMKAESALRELKAEKKHMSAVTAKDSKRAQKAAARDEQKQNMKSHKHSNGAGKSTPKNIQQPNKTKGS